MYMVYTPFHLRPEVTEIFLEGIRRLQRNYDLFLFAAVSDEDNKQLVNDFGADWVEITTDTIGRKNNEAMKHARTRKFDDIIFLDSDDLLDHRYIETYDGTPQGVEQVYMTDGDKTKIVDFECLTVPGRIMKRSDLKKSLMKTPVEYNETYMGLNGGNKGDKKYLQPSDATAMEEKGMVDILGESEVKLWEDDRVDALGNQTEVEFLRCGVNFKHIRREKPAVLDIKSQTNIWGIDTYKDEDRTVTPSHLDEVDFISDKEKAMIHETRPT